VSQLKIQVYWLGIVFWGFGLLDRTVAAFADGKISLIEAWVVLVAAVFAGGWVYLGWEE
jgi:hypothetical protein